MTVPVQCMLGCSNASVASTSRKVIISICLALVRLRLECCVLFWVPHYDRDIGKFEKVKQGTPTRLWDLIA